MGFMLFFVLLLMHFICVMRIILQVESFLKMSNKNVYFVYSLFAFHSEVKSTHIMPLL